MTEAQPLKHAVPRSHRPDLSCNCIQSFRVSLLLERRETTHDELSYDILRGTLARKQVNTLQV